LSALDDLVSRPAKIRYVGLPRTFSGWASDEVAGGGGAVTILPTPCRASGLLFACPTREYESETHATSGSTRGFQRDRPGAPLASGRLTGKIPAGAYPCLRGKPARPEARRRSFRGGRGISSRSSRRSMRIARGTGKIGDADPRSTGSLQRPTVASLIIGRAPTKRKLFGKISEPLAGP